MSNFITSIVYGVPLPYVVKKWREGFKELERYQKDAKKLKLLELKQIGNPALRNDPKIKPKQFTLSKIIAPSKNSDKLTQSNFSNYFDLITDTIGTYSFENDGFLLFEYYPKTDEENRVEQLIEIKGNWSLSDETITINWQENSLFSRKEIFNIMKTDSESYYLENEDRRLHNYYY